MALPKKNSGTQVLVDYKSTSSHIPDTSAITRPANKKRITSDDSDPGLTASGNGRIRKTMAFVGVAAVGTMLINNVFSGSAPDRAESLAQTKPLINFATGQPLLAQPFNSETPALDETIESIKQPEPEFVFNNNPSVDNITGGTDVPFVEVPEIDSLIDPAAVPVAAFINPAPLTAAKPELANDYSQEPSQILVQVQKGDSLFSVLTNHGLVQSEIANLINKPLVNKYLTTLKPGDEIELDFDGSHRLTGLTRKIDLEKTLYVTRAADNEFETVLDEQPLERSIQVAELKLDSSLFVDGAAAGLTESMIMELYSIFQWTVDFNREVRAGDMVTVLHESFSKNGKKIKNGNILAAEYRASDATHSAYRHVRNGQRTYFDANGHSLKKQFLRNPIKARITSSFNLKRKHPIRHTIRAHKGVDYGAPIGTGVSSAGDGRVVFMGVRGGYGNTVEIQHGDRYTTLYAHLSRFPKRLKQGARVTQGQIIGYVGKSGLATGPHLHYEFRVDGIHHDPQKVKLPGSSPLEKNELVAFKANIEPLRSQLASLRQTSDTIAMR